MPEYIRWLRGTFSAVTTYQEDEILVPARLGPNQAIVIHSFQWQHDGVQDAAADIVKIHLAAKSSSVILSLNDEECVEVDEVHTHGTSVEHERTVREVSRYPRMLYPFTKLFVGVTATASAAISYRIGYTIRNTRKQQIFDDMYQYRFNP